MRSVKTFLAMPQCSTGDKNTKLSAAHRIEIETSMYNGNNYYTVVSQTPLRKQLKTLVR